MKMNAKVFKEWAEKYQMIESSNYVQFWDGNTEMSSWFDKSTFKFAPADKYEELEAISEKHALELTKAKYEGKTIRAQALQLSASRLSAPHDERRYQYHMQDR